MSSVFTPLRYPGGKSSLAPLLSAVIKTNGLEGSVYAEPFAGGAGAGIKLLYAGVVSKIALNDADPRILDFWLAVIGQPNKFLDRIANTPVTVNEWYKKKAIWKNPKQYNLLERGFATFFLNRVNRSGILEGNPIGGLNQDGPYLIDARFNRKNLIKRIKRMSEWRSLISFSGLDAIDFLSAVSAQPKPPFLYLDPPYVAKGRSLYLNAYQHEHHEKLCNWLKSQDRLSWVLTYDDHPSIHKLYSWCRVERMNIRYSAQVKRQAVELLITPRRLYLPEDKPKPLRYAASAFVAV
ncbi:DNA adenine methylase [Desulfosarcina alkanivorans]|uniref:DNA adenine methylase n=1 Tax=Desulfosarcina alkanivorans TaxID=571177 RepID=UPI0012D35D07|nr:DNA adenine methylase [Desulfosarcina alkanivorans]